MWQEFYILHYYLDRGFQSRQYFYTVKKDVFLLEQNEIKVHTVAVSGKYRRRNPTLYTTYNLHIASKWDSSKHS